MGIRRVPENKSVGYGLRNRCELPGNAPLPVDLLLSHLAHLLLWHKSGYEPFLPVYTSGPFLRGKIFEGEK